MARNRIKFSGWFSAETFGGVFKVFRGYADLRDLAKISSPYYYKADQRIGYQRGIIEEHAQELKKFFKEPGEGYKLIPEIILGLRIKPEEGIVTLDSGFTEEEQRFILDPEARRSIQGTTQGQKPTKKFGRKAEITIDLTKLELNKEAIRRVDGNHRLFYAHQLEDDPNNPNKYIVPFCMIFLSSTTDKFDDYAEAMVFYNINQKGIPIESEHGFNVLLTSHLEEPQLFKKDPVLFCSKYVNDKISGYSKEFKQVFGTQPLTNTYHLIKILKENKILKFENEGFVKTALDKMIHNLHQYYSWALTEDLTIAQTFQIIPAILLILYDKDKKTEIKYWLKNYNNWIVKNELLKQFESTKPSDLWNVFKIWKEHQPKRIFVACYFSDDEKFKAIRRMIEEAIDKIKTEYKIKIEHVRIDKNRGPSFELAKEIFLDIDNADLVIADLTEERPNVYCEVGYAKARDTPFILTYQPKDKKDATKKNKIHSDLIPHKYIAYNTDSGLRDKLIEELKGFYGISSEN